MVKPKVIPAIKSDTASIRVYRGSQLSTGTYLAIMEDDFRSGIDNEHSSLEIFVDADIALEIKY